ncbi:hypothetical protein ACNKHX_13940 [Shigella flexneri]
MDRDAGEISELAQNRLAIGVRYFANACGGDAVTTGAARCAARINCISCRHRRDQVSALPDSLTTPLGSLWKLYVYAWLENPSTGAALPVSRELPGRGLLLSGWGD